MPAPGTTDPNPAMPDPTMPDPAMPDPDSADRALHRTLSQIADAHPERLAGWLANEPGHWGFFAGQAVLAVRRLIGRRLTEPERRYIWRQMWQTLEQRRRQPDA